MMRLVLCVLRKVPKTGASSTRTSFHDKKGSTNYIYSCYNTYRSYRWFFVQRCSVQCCFANNSANPRKATFNVRSSKKCYAGLLESLSWKYRYCQFPGGILKWFNSCFSLLFLLEESLATLFSLPQPLVEVTRCYLVPPSTFTLAIC